MNVLLERMKPKNSLEVWLEENNLLVSENEAMDELTNNGVVSDLCVWAGDVAEIDCPTAIKWLEKNVSIPES